MPWTDILILVILGLAAGAFGGLLGIGGSIIMIPIITLVLGEDQHMAQAAAMIVNIFVSLPAAIRHHRARAVRWDALWRILPAAIVFIIVGVETSDAVDGRLLQRFFGAFLLYVVVVNVMAMVKHQGETPRADQRVTWFRCGVVGASTGLLAGLLGIGGGIVAVPLMQRLCRLPLRQCIATSSAVMVLTACIGSFRKNMTLNTHIVDGQSLQVETSLILAGLLIPTAIFGAYIGAHLTHALPLVWVRVAFILLLLWAGIDMLAMN